MRLIEVDGNTNLIEYEKSHNYWNYDEKNKPYAILEVEKLGIVNGLLFQQAYRIYRNKKGKLFCVVRGKRVYLEKLGFRELNCDKEQD